MNQEPDYLIVIAGFAVIICAVVFVLVILRGLWCWLLRTSEISEKLSRVNANLEIIAAQNDQLVELAKLQRNALEKIADVAPPKKETVQ